ncbi:hypothetical protein ACJX0J_013884, partial [Zea mays]
SIMRLQVASPLEEISGTKLQLLRTAGENQIWKFCSTESYSWYFLIVREYILGLKMELKRKELRDEKMSNVPILATFWVFLLSYSSLSPVFIAFAAEEPKIMITGKWNNRYFPHSLLF